MISSTSASSFIHHTNILAYELKLSRYFCCPIEYIVLNARDDFHEPESHVTITILFFGIFTSTFLRLCVFAQYTSKNSDKRKKITK